MRVGFGSLLLVPDQTLNKNLLAELMDRWNCERRGFELPLGLIEITMIDVALILGIGVTGESVVLEEDVPFSDIEKFYGSSVEKRTISMTSLEKRLKSLDLRVNEDFIRTFLLFTFGTFLFPNAFGTVDSRFLLYMKDLDKIPLLAWGRAVLQDLIKWMDRRKKDDTEKYMGSCLILLQVWSYEHIDIARPMVPESYAPFPRACRWQNSSYRLRQWFTTKFDGLNREQIIWELEPTPEEKKIDIIFQLLDLENDAIEVPSPSKHSSTSVIVVDDDNLRDGFTIPEDILECRDLEVDLTKQSVAVVEDDEVNLPGNTQEKLEEQILVLQQDVKALGRDNILLSQFDEVGDEDNLRALRRLEEQNSELRNEVNHLRSENAILQNQLSSLNAHVGSELQKEVNHLRTENQILKNQLSSINGLADRLERRFCTMMI
ncbi:hypothetical protein Scep_005860 [Stephania cephalantha]|uniref:Aminotransferase-like plant mobile domain-containing protein n=1 Tax=Stephania cephalantha TaxID=152367 RepID=A0AAP0KVG7_9MAGN